MPKRKNTSDTKLVSAPKKGRKNEDCENNTRNELEKMPKRQDSSKKTEKRNRASKTVVKEENSDDREYKSGTNDMLEPTWKEYELLEERHKLITQVAKNLILLFEDGNEIPFIACYRKNETQNMTADELRHVKETYEDICALKFKMNNILKALIEQRKLNSKLKKTILSAKSIVELKYIYAPYKPPSKRNLAERAKELGLEEAAKKILKHRHVNFSSYVKSDIPEINNVEKVHKGICNIIAFIIASDTGLLKYLKPM